MTAAAMIAAVTVSLSAVLSLGTTLLPTQRAHSRAVVAVAAVLKLLLHLLNMLLAAESPLLETLLKAMVVAVLGENVLVQLVVIATVATAVCMLFCHQLQPV